nr:helix-turn-helix domain-containing protein [Streptacidiphilus pinicola]
MGHKNEEIAAGLRISVRSVERWRRAWRYSGEAAALSKGSPGRPRLSEAQIARLERELERGPQARGWSEQRWKQIQYRPHVVDGCLARHGPGLRPGRTGERRSAAARRPPDQRATGSDQVAALV